jgi:hydrogenase maturation protein HypF
LRPIALLGGEAAIREPARIAFMLLCDALGPDTVMRDDFWLRRLQLDRSSAEVFTRMIRRGTRVAWSSGMGRLFDGVAALVLGIARVSFEGEAALRLEDAADLGDSEPYPLPTMDGDADSAGDRTIPRGDWRPMIAGIAADVCRGVAPARIAGRFHATLAAWAAGLVCSLAPRPLVLSGGCFQNRLLAESVIAAVTRSGRSVFLPSRVPPGDGGLAAGQLAVALQRARARN